MKRKGPLFLARRSYRLRRWRDAARLLPVLGGFLMVLPMLWGKDGAHTRATGSDAIYLFAAWAGLILMALGLTLVLRSRGDSDEEDEG